MDHPVISKAFEQNISGNGKIYLIFKREGLFYKDSYYILTGTREEVELKIKMAYEDVESEKRDYPLADNNELLDTPFDSWCNESCIYKRMPCCDNNTLVKCATNWTHTEHTSDDDLNAFVENIKPGYYAHYTVEYL